MCYTRELLHKETGIKVSISNCFGVGFDWNDTKFQEAVECRDENIWSLLKWMALGGAEECHKAELFDELVIGNGNRTALSLLRNIEQFTDQNELPSLLKNKYLNIQGKNVITSYLDGSLGKSAKEEREQEKHNAKSKRSRRDGFVYLIRAENGLCKIGKAKNVSERMKPFSVNFPMAWMSIHNFPADDYTLAEGELHAMYSDKQDVGEWFNLNENDIKYICSIKEYKHGGFVNE